MEKSLIDKSIYIFLSILISAFYFLTNILPHIGSMVFGLLLILMLIQLIKDKKAVKFKKYENIYLYIIVFYLLIHSISLLYNGGILNRFEMRLSRIDQELKLLLILPFAFFLNYKKIKIDYFWCGMVSGAFLSFIFSLFQILSGSLRASGSYHTISFANLSILMGFLSFFSINYFYNKKKILAAIPVLALFAGISAAVLSGSRGAFLAFPVFVFIAILKNRKNFLVYLMILISVFVIYIGDKLSGHTFSNRFSEVYNNVLVLKENLNKNQFSDQQRFELWKAGIITIKKHPIAGIGQKGFKKEVKKLVKEKKVSPEIFHHKDPHNQILYDIISNGFMGGVASLMIFLFPLYIFIKRIRVNPDISYSGIVLIGSMFAFAMTETIFLRNIFMTFFVISISFLFNILRNSNKDLI